MALKTSEIGIWLISLQRDAERRERIKRQLAALRLEYSWFNAIDGHESEVKLLHNADATAYSRNMGSPLLPGKLGVYASHVEVWEALLQSPYRAALILEDDVVLHEDFLCALKMALENSDLWDLLRFNCIRAKLPVTQAKIGMYRLNAYIGPFTGNACYLIQRDTAARILPGLWPQTRALDHELNRFFLYSYRQLGLEPWSSHPDDGGVSTITGRDFSLVRKFKWYLRLPHYFLKVCNYFRRALWLLRAGMLLPKPVVRTAGLDT